jgi:aromatic ring-cleaving dioxygenase
MVGLSAFSWHSGPRQSTIFRCPRNAHDDVTMSAITSYHAHVYFDAAEHDRARSLCEAAHKALGVVVGRMHDRPVGPHPRGSCQLTIGIDQFASVIPRLIVNRGRLTIFAHAETGDALKDHTDHVIWLGPSEPLDLSTLSRAGDTTR